MNSQLTNAVGQLVDDLYTYPPADRQETYGVSPLAGVVDIVANCKRIMDEFRRRWPPGERISRIEMSREAHEQLLAEVEPQPTGEPIRSLYGIEIAVRSFLPTGSWREILADGSSRLRYPDGQILVIPPLTL